MDYSNYIKSSLELHLFFDRIMMEHCIFLDMAFMENDKEYKKISRDFYKLFSNILEKIVPIANKNISKELLSSGEIVTKNTLEAENKTINLTGIDINTNITMKELNLDSGKIDNTRHLFNTISNINKETLPLINNLIKFKQDVLKKVLSCKMYTTNYPLFINHIINEAKMYYDLLNKVENKQILSLNYIYEEELSWLDIMKEHAFFIRGNLDPTEKNLISTADDFAKEYEYILNNYSNINNLSSLNTISLNETNKFKDFKEKGEEGILDCKIKSVIIPILSDHVLREANHFIRILKQVR